MYKVNVYFVTPPQKHPPRKGTPSGVPIKRHAEGVTALPKASLSSFPNARTTDLTEEMPRLRELTTKSREF
jgi:hypothetical protein